jgi:hypothetical protein
MSYTINKTNGETLITLLDGTLDTTTGLNLVGKNYIGYGELQQENFVWLLENFANDTQPTNPLEGQCWYDTANNALKVYDGARFRTVSAKTAGTTQPTSAVVGDAWWDTVNDQYNVYSSTGWMVVGPAYSKLDGKSGAIVETVYDTSATKHTIVSSYLNNIRVAITSRDAEFTPNVALSGFTTVKPGITLSTAVSNNIFNSTARNSQLLGNVDASYYLRSDINNTAAGSLDLGGNLIIGDSLTVSGATPTVIFQNDVYTKDVAFTSNLNGTRVSSLTIDGTTGNVSVVGKPTTPLGVATKSYVDDTQTIINATIAANVFALNAAIDSNVGIINETIDDLTNRVIQNESDISDLFILDSVKATIDSPTFTGIPAAATAPMGTSTTQLASTEFVMIESNSIKANIASAGYAKEAWVKSQGFFMANGYVNFSGTTFTANAGSVSGYGAMSIKGSQGGYAGLNFIDTLGTQCNSILTNSAGNGGIYNRTSTGWVLQWSNNGDITATGDVTAFSDARLKTNVQTLANSLDITSRLRGVTYDKDGKSSLGVIAQELQTELPMLVHANEDGILSVAYGNMAGLFIENDKALYAELKDLRNQVEELKSIIANLGK